MKNKHYSVFLALAVSSFLLASVSCSKSNEKKASELLKDYAKTNVADYKSFEIMELDSVKDKYSNLYDEMIFIRYISDSQAYKDTMSDAIDRINEVEDYIYECSYELDRAKSISSEAYARQWRTYTTSKNIFTWVEAEQAAGAAQDIVDELNSRLSDAKSTKERYEKIRERCLYSYLGLIHTAFDSIEYFSPKKLGLGTVVKCRFRGEDGNMKIVEYDVLFDDEITSITSIKEKTPEAVYKQKEELVRKIQSIHSHLHTDDPSSYFDFINSDWWRQ